MTCPSKTKEGAEILVDYCAHALPPERAAEFEKHAEECVDCRSAVKAQAAAWAALDQWAPAEVSQDFEARLYARIAQEATVPEWRAWLGRIFNPAVPYSFWKALMPLTAACAVLTVGLLVRVQGTHDPAKQVRGDNVDIEQVEQTLEVLDMLAPVSQAPANPM